MSEELKPCPFCGSENLRQGNVEYSFGTDIFIKCVDCSGKMQLCAEYGETQLIKAWNRRANDETIWVYQTIDNVPTAYDPDKIVEQLEDYGNEKTRHMKNA